MHLRNRWVLASCCAPLVVLIALASCSKKRTSNDTSSQGIAANYVGDANIQSDPDVLFVEMADESSLSELFSNWNANSSASSLALDPTSYPAGSSGHQSVRLFTTGGSIATAMLYKYFPTGLDGTIYARWYVKYNVTSTFHHSGPRLGGNNPGSASGPNSPAGSLPTGSDFFYLGAELSQAKTAPATSSTFDFYNYWMHQRSTSYYPGAYYGNSFINNSEVKINLDSWNCIEVKLTLNDPVDGYGGEIAMWINGTQVSEVKGGTLGTWNEDNFTPASGGSGFEGFQWRNSENLKFNYFQILHFVDNDPSGQINSVNYDHIVVARKYIGPLAP